MKIQLILADDEITIVTEDGGIVCTREAEPIDDDTPRIATADYYEMPLTDIDPRQVTDDDNVWVHLAEGRMYHADWADKPFNSMAVLKEALAWLGHDWDDCEISTTALFPELGIQ